MRETCQEYVDRRLSEGWKVVSLRGDYLILSTPDGSMLRTVDLRNDTETLRPDAAGDETSINTQFPDETEHWDKVDEETADGTNTYVRNLGVASFQRDLYNLPASSGSGTINSITIYTVCKRGTGTAARQKASLKSNSTVTDGTETTLTTVYTSRSETWTTNPADSAAWEWADIDALQIGVSLRAASTGSYAADCTQVYVEIDYVGVTEKSSSDTGSGADAILNFLAILTGAETGSGVEALIGRAIVLAETGSGVETVLALLGKVVSDTGSGAENSYVHILEGVKESSDTGSGAEASTLAAVLEGSDVGEGVEAIVARALYAKEYPTGAIDLARVLTAAITGTGETGTGAEASLRAVFMKGTDTGSGVDASALTALFSRDDAGAGAEAITLLAAMVSHDTGVGVEEVLTYLRKLVDSGVGSEVVQLIGYIGRAMRAFTYKKPYFNTRLFSRPYFDTRVYTKGVVMDTQTFRRGATVPIWVDNKTWAGVYANPTQGFKITIWDPNGVKQLLDPPDNYEVAMEESETGKFVYYYNSQADDPTGWWPYECKGVDGTGEGAKTVNPMGSFELK